ncbi:MAG: flagellar basal body M-ring protein FliF [Clostridium butyricum]|nr:flagellar basal body M-ring protein FliF [Clostridium butyricum]
MNKLLEKVKELFGKFKSQNKKIKIAVIASVIAIIVAIISAVVYSSSTKYDILFSNLDSTDAKTVVDKLTADKVDSKIDSTTNTIYVPKEQVDKLRLDLAPTLTSGSTGYELMDSQSSFGMTDEQFKLKKKRMIEGETEKTIKSIENIENAKVSITEPESTVFAKNNDSKGSASVTLKIKDGQSISQEQVKAIVAIVSASTKNIPRENVTVVDQNGTWLTKDLNSEDTEEVNADNISKQQKAERDYEQRLQKAIIDLLEPIVGKDKVKAQVNAKLDFDSTQKTETTIDPNKVIVSQDSLKEFNNSGTGDTITESPVDNNMSNQIENNKNGNNTSSKEEQKTNYDSGKSEVKTISAQGKVLRVTASVMIDRTLTDDEVELLTKSVSNAIGLNPVNGDQLSVAGMPFDTTAADKAKADIKQMEAEQAADKKNLMMILGGVAAAVLIGLLIFIIIRRRKKKQEEEEQLFDTLIDDTIVPKEPETFDPIEFETETKNTHLENEIKKYATEKPDQVVEIIKSWLNENER